MLGRGIDLGSTTLVLPEHLAVTGQSKNSAKTNCCTNPERRYTFRDDLIDLDNLAFNDSTYNFASSAEELDAEKETCTNRSNSVLSHIFLPRDLKINKEFYIGLCWMHVGLARPHDPLLHARVAGTQGYSIIKSSNITISCAGLRWRSIAHR